MKTIFFRNQFSKDHTPFWQPWGCVGCLGRILLFLILLLLMLFLLSLFRKCGDAETDVVTEITVTTDNAWIQPVENAEEVGLPSPEDNKLPPFEGEIPNPDNGGVTKIYPNLLYVILDSENSDETFRQFATKFSSIYPAPQHKIAYYNTGAKTAVLVVPEDKRSEICQNLPQQISEVKFYVTPVEVMVCYDTETTPNDPAFRDADKSWHFKPIQAQEAWTITKGSPDIIVGIVDSYMDLSNPELKGDRCISPYSVLDGSNNVAPPADADEASAGHGTLVTALAVGNANNNEGTAGIAPKCKFIPVSIGRALNTITVVEGLLYCMYHGANVINLSVGAEFNQALVNLPVEQQITFSEQYGKQQEEMWKYVFKLADKHNTTIVWAAGNQNCFDAMDISKRDSNTIRVSAVDRNLKKADFSNFGNFPDKGRYESTISAPGVDIWGPTAGNVYKSWPGTSFSAPIITGAVALIKSVNKDLKTSQIIDILKTTGKPVEGAPEIGNLVQIREALNKAKS